MHDIILYKLAKGEASAEEKNAFVERLQNVSPQEYEQVLRDFEAVLIKTANFDRHDPVLQARILSLMRSRPSSRLRLINRWAKYAAAILLIMIGVAIYYNWFPASSGDNKIVQSTSTPQDILPGRDRAILTLSDGRQVQLNNATSETIKDGNLAIENRNGQLMYLGSQPIPSNGGVDASDANTNRNQSGGATGVGYNTMTTPRGGQYQLTLADGTKVWLNAASSITYPTVFIGNKREVSITGEVYFDVTKHARLPFVVKTKWDEIQVLGTSFNVNAYEDEKAMKTSLVDGVVKVGQQILKPGQAFINGKIIQTNIEQDIAWRNGSFSFIRSGIAEVMRQISRWYDVEIIYRGEPDEKSITGDIGRNLTLNQAINVLNNLGIKCKREENKLIVTD